ncbi:type II/IV secretion system family protein, partial [Vibrio parahaemolyticus V-223/04]
IRSNLCMSISVVS